MPDGMFAFIPPCIDSTSGHLAGLIAAGSRELALLRGRDALARRARRLGRRHPSRSQPSAPRSAIRALMPGHADSQPRSWLPEQPGVPLRGCVVAIRWRSRNRRLTRCGRCHTPARRSRSVTSTSRRYRSPTPRDGPADARRENELFKYLKLKIQLKPRHFDIGILTKKHLSSCFP